MVTELGSSQISSLLETLPGIAHVLRSPVADALVHIIRAAARLEDFRLGDAEELMRYAVRRSLMGGDEADRLVAEVQAAQQKRLDKAADRAAAAADRSKPAATAKPKPKAAAPAPAARPAPAPAARPKAHAAKPKSAKPPARARPAPKKAASKPAARPARSVRKPAKTGRKR